MTAKYGLDDGSVTDSTDTILERRWTGRGRYQERSTRELAAWFNKSIINAVYAEHDRKTLPEYIEADYDALQSDGEDFDRIASDLEADGINAAELADDFVSQATIYRHLTNHLEASKDTNNDPGGQDWRSARLDYCHQQLEDAAEAVLQEEAESGALYSGDANVQIRLFLECSTCGDTVAWERALDRGYVCEEHHEAEAEEGLSTNSVTGTDKNESKITDV